MSIRSELNNTKYYLRESRKAILGRGGEISEKAGLKDIPEAVWSIPADASLAFREDSDVAYEKVVPVGAEEYARVKSLGGMSYKLGNNNLCSGDGVYTFTNEEHIDIPLGTYKAGHYYISADDSLSGAEDYYLVGANENVWGISSGRDFYLYEDAELTLSLSSSYEMNGEGDKINGTIKDFMLCYADDEDKTYKPYQPPMLLSTKPTSLESRGANLYNAELEQGGINNLGALTSTTTRLRNVDFIVLNAGTYTLSFPQGFNAIVRTYSVDEEYVSSESGSSYNNSNILTFTISATRKIKFNFKKSADGAIYPSDISNIMLNRGTEAVPYKPYSAEPIDTKALPEAVQALDGWGLGIDAEYNNHIEWRNGRIFYVRMLDEVDLGDFTWRLFTSKHYFVTYPTVDKWSSAWDGVNMKLQDAATMPTLLCSKYNVDTYNNVAYVNLSKSKYVSYRTGDATYGTMIVVRDLHYANAKDLQDALKGVKLIYPIAEPIETDITHLFTDTSAYLKVQGGGGVIANNEREQAVPSTLKYTIKVG